MHKVRNCPLQLPRSVRKTIADNAPLPGATHESSSDWLQNFNNHLNVRSVFYKGPLLSIIPAIVDLVTLPNLLNIKIYKKDVKRALMEYQSSGNANEWQSSNFLIFNIPGLRKSRRNLASQNYAPSD